MLRLLLVLLALATWLGSGAALAQPQPGAACGGKHDSCVAECRARLFSIDPKRAACIADCEVKATQCVQAANTACHPGSPCP